MAKVFVAIYDDSATKIPHRFYHEGQNTVYRTTNVGFVEELSAIGHEPLAVLLEEDIQELEKGTYTGDNMTQEDLDFLKDSLIRWAWFDPVKGTFLGSTPV